MAFISWPLSPGISLNQIAQGLVSLTANGTFAQLYANLTSQPAGNAWPAFQAAVQNLPNLTSDDPFGGAAQPTQLAHVAPWSVNLAGIVFSAILTDIATGKSAHQVVASVRAVLLASPAPAAQPVSHRLATPAKTGKP